MRTDIVRFVGGRDVDDRAVQLSVELRGPGITRIELGCTKP